MASFADQLRNTQPTPPPQKPDARTQFRKQKGDPKRYSSSVVSAFMDRCRMEAQGGKRKCEWSTHLITDAYRKQSYKISYYGWGEKGPAREYAMEVKSLIEKEISVMNFSSYSVSVISCNSSGYAGKTATAYGFKVVARW